VRAVVANGPGQPLVVDVPGRPPGQVPPTAVTSSRGIREQAPERHAALRLGPLIRDIPAHDDFTEAGAPFTGTGRRTHITPAGVTQA
jgi:hypothetical protein